MGTNQRLERRHVTATCPLDQVAFAFGSRLHEPSVRDARTSVMRASRCAQNPRGSGPSRDLWVARNIAAAQDLARDEEGGNPGEEHEDEGQHVDGRGG